MAQTLASLKGLPARHVRQGLLDAIDRFVGDEKLHDDLTLVVITLERTPYLSRAQGSRFHEVHGPEHHSDLSSETEVD